MDNLRATGAVALLWISVALAAAAQEAAAPVERRMSQTELLARAGSATEPVVVLDVRTAEEFVAGHVPGARHLPHDQIAQRIGELEALRDRDVVVYCRSGRRSQLALGVLRAHGFTRLWQLDGDFLAWQAQGRPIEAGTPATTETVTPAPQ
ncbi:MAG: rhodanese-like domain-containing protein [Gammaproteobacteria bacterium]|nr:rhodanese-like domain-containing protein [Gammaproteobacteria bacterium]